MKFLQMNFLPRSADLALLVLRLWFGLALLSLHGWGKLTSFSERAGKFADPFGIGSGLSLAMVVFAEVVCTALIIGGLFTRLAAVVVGFNMFMAFWYAHGARLTGPGNGEMAFLFLGAFLVIVTAGPGRFSLDAKMGAKV